MIINNIDVEIIKKNIKNMHLYILSPDGRVRVTAPLFISEKEIREFVLSKTDWIKSQQSKMAEMPKQYKLSFADGEKIFVWGTEYTLRIVTGSELSIHLVNDEAVFTIKRNTSYQQKEQFLKEWYRAQLKEQINIYLNKWQSITKLQCTACQTKDMKTRWGTCNTKTNKLWFNLNLAKRPEKCLEYVVLHELAHTKIPNHGLEFKAILSEYMPEWREIQKQLNEFQIVD